MEFLKVEKFVPQFEFDNIISALSTGECARGRLGVSRVYEGARWQRGQQRESR